MKVFNIQLTSKNNLTLTILFADEQYKIIYDGGIIGGLTLSGKQHHFILPEHVIPGQLPLYDYKKTNENVDIEPLTLNTKTIEEIAAQIRQAIA